MIGSTDTRKDDELVKKRVTQALSPAKSAEARFRAPVVKGGPLRRTLPPTRDTFGPRIMTREGIKPPKSIGDVYRYNREMQAQKQTEDIANTKAKTAIDASRASALSKHYSASDSDAIKRTVLMGKHYEASDANAATRTGIFASAEKRNAALEPRKVAALEKLRDAQIATAEEGILASQTAREGAALSNKFTDNVTSARIALAENPSDPNNQIRVQALEGQLAKPTTEADKMKADQAVMNGFSKFLATQPLGVTNTEEGTQKAFKQYLKYLKAVGDPLALYAEEASTMAGDTEDETTSDYIRRINSEL